MMHCRQCDKKMNSEQSAHEHYFSKKHQRAVSTGLADEIKLELQERVISSEKNSFIPCLGTCLISETFKTNETPETSQIASKDIVKSINARRGIKGKDLSIYRTPSGNFYCSYCDHTVNSAIQFQDHVNSKRHRWRKFDFKSAKI